MHSSSVSFAGSTITRTSRPAEIAYVLLTPSKELPISSNWVIRLV